MKTIINISSQLGIKGGVELTHYCAAKAGVIGFTKALSLEVAKHNVLVNAIAPGPIETPLVEGISQDWKNDKAKELPLRRFGTAEEVAPVAVLLASEPGGNLFVGQTLGPNSGDVKPLTGAEYLSANIKAAMGDDEARRIVRSADDSTSTNTGLTLAPLS